MKARECIYVRDSITWYVLHLIVSVPPLTTFEAYIYDQSAFEGHPRIITLVRSQHECPLTIKLPTLLRESLYWQGQSHDERLRGTGFGGVGGRV